LISRDERVFAPGESLIERQLTRGETADWLAVGADDGGVLLLVDQTGGAAEDRLLFAGGRAQHEHELEVLRRRLEAESLQRQRAETNDLAGPVHRLVGDEVRQVDRLGGRLFDNLAGHRLAGLLDLGPVFRGSSRRAMTSGELDTGLERRSGGRVTSRSPLGSSFSSKIGFSSPSARREP
jgi:hypothetical protein